MADVHAADTTLGVEAGQAAAGVGTDRHPVRRGPARQVALQALRRAPGVLAILDREGGQVDVTTVPGQRDGFVEQCLATVDVGRVEHARRDLAFAQRTTHEIQATRTIAQVEVQHAGFAGHEAGHVGIGGETENFIEGRLARAVVADREFADPEQRLEQHQVSTHVARQRREGDVIAAGVAERVEAFLAQGINLREQVARSARDIVSAEESDDGRDAGERVARQRHRRDPGLEACFAATARDVHVTVDEAGDQSQSGKVDLR